MKIIQFIGPKMPLLRNAEHNHEFFKAAGFESAVFSCEPEDMDGVIRSERPDRVVIRGQWCPVGALYALFRQRPGTAFYITNHSSVSQMYNQREFIYYMDTFEFLGKLPNVIHTSVDYGTQVFLRSLQLGRVDCTPNVYMIPADVDRSRIPHPEEEYHVGLFCAYRIQKNIPTIAAAFCVLQRMLAADGRRLFVHFVVKDDRLDQLGQYDIMLRPALRAGAAIVNEGWKQDGRAHLNLCRRMDVHAQVSFAETFNYACGDAIVCGCPVVGSYAIPWLPDGWKATRPHDPAEIAQLLYAAEGWDVSLGVRALRAANRTNAMDSLLGYALCDRQEAGQIVERLFP